jgi:hypothetical protein
MRLRAIPAIASLLLATANAAAGPILIDYEDGQGIRRLSGGTLGFLNGLLIKVTSFEDRTVLEYPLSSLQGAVTEAYLDLWVQNADPGGPAGLIDLFIYPADGQVASSEFFSGEYATSFSANIGFQVIALDLTHVVQAAMASEHPYLGIRLSTSGPDRFILGSAVGAPEPRLRVIPEPGSAACFVVVLVALARHRSTRRSRRMQISA